MIVDADKFQALFFRPLTDAERGRVEALLPWAESMLAAEFGRVGRDFAAELASVPWLSDAAAQVIVEMVSASVTVGGDAGRVSSSTTAGLVSESGTWADPSSSAWGQMVVTDRHRQLLGLCSAAPSGRFPRPWRWPERRAR